MSRITLQWAVGLFCVVIGATMFVAPHQFSSPSFAALQPYLTWWGAGFLAAGIALVHVSVTGARPWIVVAVHLAAAAAFLVLARGFAMTGAWSGTSMYAVLALGTALAAFLRGGRSHDPSDEGELFAVVLGLAGAITGVFILTVPHQFRAPFYDLIRPYLPWSGAAFVVGGLTLAVTQLVRVPRWLEWAGCWVGAGAFYVFFVAVGLPIVSWTAIALYGGFGTMLALLPWLGPRLRTLDAGSLRTRLALILSTATSLALILGVTLGLQQHEPIGAEAVARAQTMRNVALGLLLLIIALSTAAAVILAGWLAAPLRALKRMVDRFTEEDLGALVPTSSILEIRHLAAAFTQMRESLIAREAERRRAEKEREELLVREKAAHAEAKAERREAEIFAELASSLNATLDLDIVLQKVAQAAKELCASDWAHISLRDAESGSDTLVVRYQVAARHEGSIGFRIEPGKGLEGHVFVTGAPMRTEGYARDPRISKEYLAAATAEGVVAELAVPIVIDGRVEGTICVDNRSARPFTNRDEGLLLRLAVHAAIAVKNVGLLTREQAARAEAEAASRAKDEFLAMLGHELRNPLGAISNSVILLDRVGTAGDEPARLRAIITRQTRQLTRLVDDLLDVARLTSGKIVLDRRPTNLKEIAEDALASLGHRGRMTGHNLLFTAESAWVEGDPARLEQVISNLLENAEKYTPSGGRIELTIQSEEGEAVLRVRDTGMGIPAQLLPRIFDAFVQGAQTPDRPKGGLGVGLSVVKRLVELHGGSVAMSSDGPGKGSEFVVRLPRLREAPTTGAPLEHALSSSGSRHVVVVEDDGDSRYVLCRLLETWGHRVEEAPDGRRGLELMLASPPEIALIDVGLPELDGYAVARAIRAAPEGDRIFMVAVTGYGQPQDQRRAKEAGFDAHLVKPFLSHDLLSLLTALGSEPRRGSSTNQT